jgi:hypothetical protein
MGRSFTVALMTGFFMIITGVAFGINAGVVAGVAIIAGAYAILGLWRWWCPVNPCYFWGAILWVLKRVFVGGMLMSLMSLSVAGLLLTLCFGAAAGMVTARLRFNRCPMPSLTTPLQQLPLW